MSGVATYTASMHLQLLTVSVVASVLLAHHGSDGAVGDVYSIGTGRMDITGPAVEINLVGYSYDIII